jgi:hypothetical protein
MTSAEFTAKIDKSRKVRDEITEIENQLKRKQMERDAIDEDNWSSAQLVVPSVAGSPKHGKNSPLYQRMGYVATSERKSGLTRKKKNNNVDENK